MNVLGIRCSNTDYAYAVLSGSQGAPAVAEAGCIALPKGYSQPEKLNWLLHELESLNQRCEIKAWGIKGAEQIAAKGHAYVARVELEAIVSLAAARAGYDSVTRKVKSTIAKDLGLKGTAKALKYDLDHSKINGLDDMSEKETEAVLTAWSCLGS